MIQFSDTTTKNGLVQFYEKELRFDYGTVSGNPELLYEFTARANQAYEDFWFKALAAAGTWQLDDSNHTDYPIIKTTLTSGQRSYLFFQDENANEVIEIQKVFILPSATATEYVELDPINELNESEILTEGSTTGTPGKYGKIANGIFLDIPTSYTVANGLKMIIARAPSYFVSTDETKKPGVPSMFHKYFYLNPALEYARIHSFSNYAAIADKVLIEEDKIEEHFSRRERDVTDVATPEPINYI